MNNKTKATLKIVFFSLLLTSFALTQILLLTIVGEDAYVLIPIFLLVVPDVFLIRGLVKNSKICKGITNETATTATISSQANNKTSSTSQNTTNNSAAITNTNNNISVPQYAQEIAYKATAFRDYFKTTVVEGLPVPTGSKCSLYLKSNGILCESVGTEFSIPKERIISVVVDKSKNIQKQVVSSSGGALAGGLMFGAVGAAIGGRAKTKNVVSKKTFLSVVYKGKDGEIKSLLLEPMQNDVYNLKSATKVYSQNNVVSHEKIEL